MISKITLKDFCYIVTYGRRDAQDLCIEFSLTRKTMLIPIYRLN